MIHRTIILTGKLLQISKTKTSLVFLNNSKSFMTHQIADLQSQVESQIRRTNMLELPFGGSPYSTPRLHMPRTKRSTQDEGPKTKKRKLDEPEPKALVQPKSLNIQKLQKALTKVISERRTESTQKEKEIRVILIFLVSSF